MMKKTDHIEHWKSLAIEDLDTAVFMATGGRHVPALFYFHLSTEKLLKAFWVKNNVSNTPPFIHDLPKLAAASGLTWAIEDPDLLRIMNDWNIEARYPDYKRAIHHLATTQYLQHRQQLVEQCINGYYQIFRGNYFRLSAIITASRFQSAPRGALRLLREGKPARVERY